MRSREGGMWIKHSHVEAMLPAIIITIAAATTVLIIAAAVPTITSAGSAVSMEVA
jgi:hypothetical protein